jgi:hypothetical protein
MPQILLDGFQVFEHRRAQLTLIVSIAELLRQPLGNLFQHGQAHGNVKSIQQVLGFRVKVHLYAAHVLTTV